MPKKTPVSVRPIRHRKYKFQVIVPPELNEGVRERKYFVTRQRSTIILRLTSWYERRTSAPDCFKCPNHFRQEALDCAGRLGEHKATLTEAVNFYIRHLRVTGKSCTVSELVEKFLPAKKLLGAPNATCAT